MWGSPGTGWMDGNGRMEGVGTGLDGRMRVGAGLDGPGWVGGAGLAEPVAGVLALGGRTDGGGR